MENSFNNILHNENIFISNSIIINNPSIQNLINSKNYIESYTKPVNKIENYFHVKKIQSALSPAPKKSTKKKNFLLDIKVSSINKYITPIPKTRFSSIFNQKNMGKDKNLIYPNNFSKNFMQNSKESIKNEKLPQDSKKNTIKKLYLDTGNIKNNNNAKGSLTKVIFEPLNNENRNSDNIMLETTYQKKELKSGLKNGLAKIKKSKYLKKIYIEPKNNLNLKEYTFGKEIGKGTFGSIFCVKWNVNNKYYAMKKEILKNIEDIESRIKACIIIQNFINKTGNQGITKLYGSLCLKNNIINKKDKNLVNQYIYYELMEKGDKDWETEIKERSENNNYYSEKEILNIITQLIGTLSLMQKNHITHRDIKPQNILIIKGKYKLCEFGELRTLQRSGLIIQRIRGSELYMSPILFQGLHKNLIQVKHNTYKSDVFSLGMCFFLACSLTYSGVDSIREIDDMEKIKIILFQHLSKRYSDKLILFIFSMLEIDEDKRISFIQLEEKMKLLL